MSYIIESDGYVYPHELDARMVTLLDEIRDTPSDDDALDELQEELAVLLEFKEAVISRVGDWANATVVPRHSFKGHARDYAEDHVEGLDLVAAHVDWDAFADNLIDDYAVVESSSGDEYLVR